VIGLDPGSIRTGYACYSDHKTLDSAGYLKGKRRQDPAWDRVLAMCVALRELIEKFTPECIAIEVTTGHVNRGRHRGQGAGLPTYGMAVGGLYVYACVLAETSDPTFEVWPFAENVWTKGRTKESRRQSVWMAEQRYRHMIAKDSDGDIADAICLCWTAEAKSVVVNAGSGKVVGGTQELCKRQIRRERRVCPWVR